jgi:hypothetical protein
MATFVQALSQARRKAALSGRPLSQQEAQGITAGYAEVASERAARSKSLSLQEEGLDQTKMLEEKRLAQQNEQFAKELAQRQAEQRSAEKAQKQQAIGTGAAAGAAIGGYVAAGTSVGGPVGAVIGAAVGVVAAVVSGDSHLCTEYTRVANELDDAHQAAFRALRFFAREYYPNAFQYYLKWGPEIINGIRNAHYGTERYEEWWGQFHRDIIRPMLMANAQDTAPYRAYIYHCRDVLFPTYAPKHAEGAEQAVLDDEFHIRWAVDDPRLTGFEEVAHG